MLGRCCEFQAFVVRISAGRSGGLLSISSHCCSFDRAGLVKVKEVQGRAIGELVAALFQANSSPPPQSQSDVQSAEWENIPKTVSRTFVSVQKFSNTKSNQLTGIPVIIGC